MSIIIPRWNDDTLTREDDPLGPRHGTAWWSTPRGDLGFPVYYDTDPNGFHFTLSIEFRDEVARQRFRRRLLEDLFRIFPRARVPGEDW